MGIFSQGKAETSFSMNNIIRYFLKSQKLIREGETGRLRRQSDDEYSFVPLNRDSGNNLDRGVLNLLKDGASLPHS